MRVETQEVVASQLEPGDLYVPDVAVNIRSLMAAAKADNLRSFAVQVRLEGPWLPYQAKATVTRVRIVLEEGDAGYGVTNSARPPTKPGDSARAKYWAIHGSLNWPDHSKDDQALPHRKAINYRAWSTVLGREVTTGKTLSADDWGRLATWADRVFENEYQEPEELRRWREGTHPVAQGLFAVGGAS